MSKFNYQSVSGFLRTDGRKMRNGKGEEVILRGWGAGNWTNPEGFMVAGPVLLEPIASVKVVVPDDYTGDVMGDLNKRRGRVLGMNPLAGGLQEIVADVPMTGMFGYCTVLRSMTGGRGVYEYEFARYEQAPADVQAAEIEKRAAEE